MHRSALLLHGENILGVAILVLLALVAGVVALCVWLVKLVRRKSGKRQRE